MTEFRKPGVCSPNRRRRLQAAPAVAATLQAGASLRFVERPLGSIEIYDWLIGHVVFPPLPSGTENWGAVRSVMPEGARI